MFRRLGRKEWRCFECGHNEYNKLVEILLSVQEGNNRKTSSFWQMRGDCVTG